LIPTHILLFETKNRPKKEGIRLNVVECHIRDSRAKYVTKIICCENHSIRMYIEIIIINVLTLPPML